MVQPVLTILRRGLGAVAALSILTAAAAVADDVPDRWRQQFPKTDFAVRSIPLDEILSGGPPRDGIPSIDDPRFVAVAEETGLPDEEPVISLVVDGDARAYPLRILIWHEIVNDTVGGTPVAVTYCPLCNAAIAFLREVDGRILDFGTTGKLRHSDLVMYDRQTESWWQQFDGTAIIGSQTGRQLERLPVRIEAWNLFRGRHPDGRVLVPTDPAMRPYGRNPYVGYDSAVQPFLFAGALPERIPAMAYVVAVDGQAWTLDLIRRTGPIRHRDLVIRWTAGNRSALDAGHISEGRDIGNVVVQREVAGTAVDVPYDLTFAFVFHAFLPDAPIHD